MMGPLLNAVRLQAQRAMADIVVSRIAEVTSYDPNTFSVRVQLQPENIMTGWIPIASIWIGNGWGMFVPPNVGDMVSVDFVGGDLEGGVAVGRFWNDIDQPLAVQSGEFWLVHKNGQFVKLTNDGKLTLSDAHGATISLNGNGTISSTGTWSHTGDFNATGTVTGQTDVVGGGKSLKTHVHSGVQSGSSNSGPPV